MKKPFRISSSAIIWP